MGKIVVVFHVQMIVQMANLVTPVWRGFALLSNVLILEKDRILLWVE